MWLWNSRLTIPNDARTIAEYQLLIDKYARFLSNLEKQGHKIIDDDRKKYLLKIKLHIEEQMNVKKFLTMMTMKSTTMMTMKSTTMMTMKSTTMNCTKITI